MAEIYALVRGGVVVNTIAWDGDTGTWEPPSGASAVEIPADAGGVSIGWSYNGTAFVAPPS